MSLRGHRFELGAAVGLALACSPSTLVGVPGLESAVVFGVLLPPVFAASAAHRASVARREPAPAASVLMALLAPTLAMLAILGVQSARHLFDPGCASMDGVPRLVLGPWPGMLLAALVGEGIGRLVARPARASVLAVLAVLGSYAIVVYEVVATPAVFVFTIFGGHWPGPIYDDVTDLPVELLTYRGLTALAILSLALWLRFLPDRAAVGRRIGLLLAAAAGVAFVALTFSGERFGHRTSVARIDTALGARVAGPRCVVHLPSETPVVERHRTLAECEAHVRGVERTLGVRRRAPLHAFVYRTAAEKGALVGAAETYVAKPWLGEIHVQREAFPHAVMRHEIVHVLAAEFGAWPFRVSGRLGGLVMNPALVEGLAVAAADEARDGFDADTWSRAMLELGQLPSADALMGAGFLGQGAHASYQAAGSFVAHLLRVRGPRAVGAMYRSGRVGDAATLARLERGWHAHLRTLTLPREALELARVRLLDRGLFSTRCARLRERLGRELAEARARHDDARTLGTCRRLVAIDSRDAGARLAQVQAWARAGQLERAEQGLARVERERIAPASLLARASLVLGDAYVLSRPDSPAALARAEQLYRGALAVPQAEDVARSLEVRLFALGRSAPTRRVLFDAVGERGREAPSEALVVAGLLGVEEPEALALARYLAARRILGARHEPRVVAWLEDAKTRGLPTARLRRETERLLAMEALRVALERAASREARDHARARLEALLAEPLLRAEARTGLALLAGLP